MKRTLSMLVLLGLAGTACVSGPDVTSVTSVASSGTTVDDPRTPVILDYSPTVSDAGALVFLAVHPDLRLIGVTLPGPGESHCEFGVAHTRGALAAFGLGDVPVACGADEGYGELNPFPAEWRQNADTIALPETESDEWPLPAALMAQLIAASTRPVEIVAVGPLTNLALLLDAHPEVANRIAGITIMGGAVDVSGNVPPFAWENANEHAEVNFWVDPAAAARVIASGVPITLVPLDATNFVPVDAKFRSALLSTPMSPASEVLGAVWRGAPEWIQGGYYLWDELAAVVLADPDLVEFETRSLVVDIHDDTVAGWSREDPAGTPVRVAVSADRVAFETLFLSTVLGRPVTIERLVATAAEREYFTTVAAISGEFDAAQAEVFTAAAEGLGVDLDDADEEAFREVMLVAIPQILAGPMTEFLAALNGTPSPESLAALHASWVAALSDLLAHQDAVLAALEEAASEGGEIFEQPYIMRFLEACGALGAAATSRGMSVNLGC